MNMKKTIAAISAATVAMSAIAATVSADDSTEAAQGSITYDLVRETRTIDDGNATITYQATGLNLVDSSFLTIELGNTYVPTAAGNNGIKWENSAIVVTVKNPDTNKTVTFNLNTATDADFYSNWIKYKENNVGLDIVIPVALNSTDGIASSIYDQNIQVDVVVKTKHVIKDDALKNLNTTVDTIVNGVATPAPYGVDCKISAASAYDTTTHDATVMAAPTTSQALEDAQYNLALFDATDSTGGAVSINLANGRAYSVPEANTAAETALIATYQTYLDNIATIFAADHMADSTLTLNSNIAGDSDDAPWAEIIADDTLAEPTSNGTTVEVDGETASYQDVIDVITAARLVLTNRATAYNNARTPLVTAVATATANLDGTRTTNVQARFSEVTNAGEKVHLYPMLTTLDGVAIPSATNGIYTTSRTTGSACYKADLIDYLEINEYNTDKPSQAMLGSKIGKVGYVNVLPVLNDIIANNSNVTFTFTTSALYVKTDVDAAKSNEYGEGFIEVKDKYWYHPTFNQHLYDANGYYGTENSGYVGTNNAWAFNLFSGGLVVNNKYTMALNNTATFDWGESTLSFDWEDITKDKVTNAKLLLEYMNLYTSTNWFWDSFTVTYSNGDAEDVGTGAGDEAETDVVEEEEVVEETEAPVEEETAVEETEAPAEEAENPTTGNAPIALAVIPVALAAAAVVAKKRG